MLKRLVGNSSPTWRALYGQKADGIEGQEPVGWHRCQDRGVPGCGHGSGWQEWPDSEGQWTEGQPPGKESCGNETFVPLVLALNYKTGYV